MKECSFYTINDVAKMKGCSYQKASNIIRAVKKNYCEKYNVSREIFVAGKIDKHIFDEFNKYCN